MKVLRKIITGFLVIFISLFLLCVIVAAGFLYTFDANDYKKELAEAAKTFTGRSINIAGDIDVSFYPQIAIKIEKLTVENPPGFSKSTFATIGEFDVKIEVMPLFQKRLNIEKLVLRRAVIDFERNAAGGNNWSDFIHASASDDTEAGTGLSGFSIGGVEVTDSKLAWLDVGTGKRFKVSKMKLSTEAVVKGRPLPVVLNAFVRSNQPEWRASVFAKTTLEFDDDSPVFNAHKLKLVVKAKLPSSDLEKISIAMITEGMINVQTRTATLSNAKLSVLGLIMTGELNVENIFSVPVIHGPLKIKTFEAGVLAKRFKVKLPQLSNPESLNNISLSTSFKTDFDSVYLNDLAANVDNSSVTGFIRISDFQQPVVSYDLNIDNINLPDYQVADESGKGEWPVSLDMIRSSDIAGLLKVEVITVSDDIELTEFNMSSQIKDGSVEASSVTMLVGESEVGATVRFDIRDTPKGVLTVNVDNVDAAASINPLLKTILGDEVIVFEGSVNATADFQVVGKNLAELKKSVKGVVNITMDGPLVQGIDLDHTSRSIVSDYSKKNNFRTRRSYVTEYDPDRITEFNKLSATFNIANGKWLNNDLLLSSEEFNVTGSGKIDFTNRKLDYRPVIDVNVTNRVDVRDKLRDHPMEYHTYGSFKKVSYEFDIDKYDLLVGRLLVQEAKMRRIKHKNQKKQDSWNKYKSK